MKKKITCLINTNDTIMRQFDVIKPSFISTKMSRFGTYRSLFSGDAN